MDLLGFSMCFSASASFTAGALLIPMSLYAIGSCVALNKKHFMCLAAIPLFFGIQQIFEGFVWLSLNQNNIAETHIYSLGFLFFSHFFWLFWVPLSIYVLSEKGKVKNLLGFMTIFGFIFGAIVYMPFLLSPESVQTSFDANRISYNAQTIFGSLFDTQWPRLLYMVIIILPFWLASYASIRWFGLLVLASVLITYMFYAYAFNSVWCFFSAIISMGIIAIVQHLPSNRENYPKDAHAES